MQDNLGALSLRLPPQRLDDTRTMELGFPHEFLAQGRHFVFGETYDLIDDHRAQALTVVPG
jgi:hypothetical protein